MELKRKESMMQMCIPTSQAIRRIGTSQQGSGRFWVNRFNRTLNANCCDPREVNLHLNGGKALSTFVDLYVFTLFDFDDNKLFC